MAPVGRLHLVGKEQTPTTDGPRLRGVPSHFELRAELQAQGLSPKTVDDYYRCINTADRWFTGRGSSAAKANGDLVAKYADTRPLTWSSRKELRYSLQWYWEIIHRRNAPVAVIRLPPQPDWPCRALTEEEALQLALTARQIGDHRGFAVYLGLYQAMRRAEIARPRWSDFGRMTMKVVGKGMKERTIDVSPSVLDHRYFRHPPTRAEVAAGVSEFVFPGRFGGPAGPTTIWKWIRAVAKEAGVDGVTPHRLRHTCLATQNDNTKDLRSVQAFAGHAHSSTTEHYTRAKASNMRAAMMSVDYLSERPKRPKRSPAPPLWPGQSSLFGDGDDEDEDD